MSQDTPLSHAETKMKEQGNSDKWRFAIGTTSRVPNCAGLHYLILDYDLENLPILPAGIWFVQRTPNGFHCYSRKIGTFNQVIHWAMYANADPAWIRIGCKRGYLFLADKQPILLPWPVERMKIGKDRKTWEKH